MPIWLVTIQLFCVRADRRFICSLIKVHKFNKSHQITATVKRYWVQKGAIATAVFDKLFCLEVNSPKLTD
ncbi:MAG: hypothetical protein WBD47_13645 [Phormidesmis sp.]